MCYLQHFPMITPSAFAARRAAMARQVQQSYDAQEGLTFETTEDVK